MKYRIDKTNEQLHIEIVGVGDSEDQVLGAFEQCQEGRCACPTNQYEKLRSLDMETGPDAIKLRLKPKPGEAFEQEEIEKCLDFTIESASAGGST
jgi:hypothetical protein